MNNTWTTASTIEAIANKVCEATNAFEFAANMETALKVLKGDRDLHMSVVLRALEIKPQLVVQYVEMVKKLGLDNPNCINRTLQ